MEALTVFAVRIAEASHVSEVRRTAVAAAARLGFDDTEQGKLAIAVTEAATNLLKHAGGGEVIVRGLSDRAEAGLEIVAFDSGPGISDVGACLRDGYSTAGSMGTGLGAISRLASSSEIYTRTGQGTILQASWYRGKPGAPPAHDIAMFQIPKPGEIACGDFCTVRAGRAGTIVMIADGLGHGPLAAEAAQAAAAAFHRGSGSPAALLESVHGSLSGTRGAAVSIAEIDEEKSVVRFAGLGNVAGAVSDLFQVRHLVSMNGIAGHQASSIRQFESAWSPQSILILHSDGISTKWDLAQYPGIGSKPASLLAAALYRDFRRATDDASIIVAKAAR